MYIMLAGAVLAIINVYNVSWDCISYIMLAGAVLAIINVYNVSWGLY